MRQETEMKLICGSMEHVSLNGSRTALTAWTVHRVDALGHPILRTSDVET